jgi:hypothetical protein
MTEEKVVPVWKYETQYVISESGRVFSIKRKKELKPHLTENGYHRICLYSLTRKKGKSHNVHRLVLQSFTKSDFPDKDAAHKDGTRLNNHIDNLYWATPIENGRDKVIHGRNRPGEQNHRAKITEDEVRLLIKMHRENANYPNVRKILARAFGLSKDHVQNIINGRFWNHVTGFPRRRADRRLWEKT